jgi:cytochrome c-type biogenesis protein
MEGKIPLAFVAGLLSFVTPCVLPLVPGYLSAVSGVQVGVGGRRVVAASVPFILGFTAVFVALGAAAAAAGGLFDDNQELVF